MAFYLVEAKPHLHKLKSLRERLDQSVIKKLKPFGNTLHQSLINARLKPNGFAIWEEEDYCSPPLARERAAILDHYFNQLRVKSVTEGEGWQEIEGLPTLWNESEF
jgi:hypothetical protein